MVIENDVWLDQKMIFSGNGRNHVWDKVIIAAKAVVTKDVPFICNSRWNSGKMVKYRFPKSIIFKL